MFKLAPAIRMPWDMVVFLTITTVGFGISVKKLAYPERSPSSSVSLFEEIPVLRGGSAGVLDFGCLENKAGTDRHMVEEIAVRLKGRFCFFKSGNVVLDTVKIKNISTRSNEILMYWGDKGTFVTDGILLNSGKNIIQLEWNDKNQEKKVLIAEVFGK